MAGSSDGREQRPQGAATAGSSERKDLAAYGSVALRGYLAILSHVSILSPVIEEKEVCSPQMHANQWESRTMPSKHLKSAMAA